MFFQNVLRIGTFIVLLGGTANAAVVGMAPVDEVQDLVVTDVTDDVAPEERSAPNAFENGPGEFAELDFSHAVNSSNGSASFRIDVAQDVASLSMVVGDPFSGGSGPAVISLLKMAPAGTPAELFMSTLFLNELASHNLADVLLVSSILNSLFAGSDSGIPYSDAIATGIGIGGERYGSDGLFGAGPGTGPSGISAAFGSEESVSSPRFDTSTGLSYGIYAQSVGGGGVYAHTVGRNSPAPIPLPAGLLLLPAGLGALVLVGRRRKRPA